MFPCFDDGKPRQCDWCEKFYCGAYWKCSKNSQLVKLGKSIFPGVSGDSLNKNKFEQGVLEDYVKAKGFNHRQFAEVMMKTALNDAWDAKNESDKDVNLGPEMSVCAGCNLKVSD